MNTSERPTVKKPTYSRNRSRGASQTWPRCQADTDLDPEDDLIVSARLIERVIGGDPEERRHRAEQDRLIQLEHACKETNQRVSQLLGELNARTKTPSNSPASQELWRPQEKTAALAQQTDDIPRHQSLLFWRDIQQLIDACYHVSTRLLDGEPEAQRIARRLQTRSVGLATLIADGYPGSASGHHTDEGPRWQAVLVEVDAVIAAIKNDLEQSLELASAADVTNALYACGAASAKISLEFSD
jgi:hypothetical protein